MELKQLHFFVVCAQTKSFSKAASLLFTAQSNVSKVIKSLEAELGVELFIRKQYGIELTEKGKQVLDYANTTLESAQKIVSFSQQDIREVFHISYNPSSWMASAFCRYYEEFGQKDVAYYVMSLSTNEIIRRLIDEQDDLGFIFLMEKQLPDLQSNLSRNHLSFVKLKKTNALLYYGNEASYQQGRQKMESEEPLALVQGYEDELALSSFWQANNGEEEERMRLRTAVTTNSDYLMQRLLKNTSLGNISGGDLSQKDNPSMYSYELSNDDEAVLFGCLFRNDRNLGSIPLHFLNYIRNSLQKEL